MHASQKYNFLSQAEILKWINYMLQSRPGKHTFVYITTVSTERCLAINRRNMLHIQLSDISQHYGKLNLSFFNQFHSVNFKALMCADKKFNEALIVVMELLFSVVILIKRPGRECWYHRERATNGIYLCFQSHNVVCSVAIPRYWRMKGLSDRSFKHTRWADLKQRALNKLSLCLLLWLSHKSITISIPM